MVLEKKKKLWKVYRRVEGQTDGRTDDRPQVTRKRSIGYKRSEVDRKPLASRNGKKVERLLKEKKILTKWISGETLLKKSRHENNKKQCS